ncbi:MAG: HupE/UreJ family protein [Granulosicoccus sp.]
MTYCKKHAAPAAILCSFLLLLLLFASDASAHAPRENYVWVNIEVDHVSGRFEIHKRDIKDKLGIDLDTPGVDTLDAVKRTAPEVQAYLLENFSLDYNGENQEIQFLEPSLFDDNGSPFIQYNYRTEGVPQDDQMFIRNTIFLSEQMLKDDPLHRSLIVTEYNRFRDLEFGHESTALVFGPHLQESSLSVADPPGILIWKDFFYQGLLHIWIGLDHILFLLTLLLTAVMTRQGRRWEPVERGRDVLINTIKVVTVFTVSHSITLAMAVLGLVTVPAAPVEAIIALSIIVVALNNLFPLFKAHAWVLIFVFGLIHGLGFASAMGDLQFRNVAIEKVLLMFNLGVEIGQIAIVLVALPILFLLRKMPVYRKVLLPGASVVMVILASYWLGSRLGWWA